MSSVLKDIADILHINGFGVVNKQIFIGMSVRPEPDSIITVRNAGSFNPDNPALDIHLEYPSVQLIVREEKGENVKCEEKAYAIKDCLKRVVNFVINDNRYVFINHQLGPLDIGIDVKMRPTYSLNMLCLRTRSIDYGLSD